MRPTTEDATVVAVRQCRLQVSQEHWLFAEARAKEIDAYWCSRLMDSPGLFNGRVYLAREAKIEGAVLSATLFPTDFKAFLYWRELGYSDECAIDIFGSALVVSADGAVLLGRQGGRNINSGLAYCPGGLIDGRDVRSDGTVDILGSIRRELREETGLDEETVFNVPGYFITRLGPQISIAAEFRSTLGAEALRARIIDYLSRDPNPELQDAVVIPSMEAANSVAMPSFMHPLLAVHFAGGSKA